MTGRPYFIVNVEVAIKHAGKYLLIRRSTQEEHSTGTLSLPGGKLDYEEVSPEALEKALKRELDEEIDITLGEVHYLESKAFMMDTGEWCLSVCFFCDDFTGEAKAKSKDEIDGCYWLNPSELDQQINCPPWTKQSIKQAESYSSPS